MTLKDKLMVKHPNLRIPTYVKDRYSFALKAYTPKFPPLSTSDMALASAPSFPLWFVCREFCKIHKNEYSKLAHRVTLTKLDLYSFKGHLHVDIKNVRVETPIHEGEESIKFLFKSYSPYSSGKFMTIKQ